MTVLAPCAGLLIDKENVRFENINFVGSQTASTDDANPPMTALVHCAQAGRSSVAARSVVRGGRGRRGRSWFRRPRGADQRRPSDDGARAVPAVPAGIRDSPPLPSAGTIRLWPGQAEVSLPSGRVRLADCVLRHVGTGVDCRTVGAMAIELCNTLHLDSGALVSLDHCPPRGRTAVDRSVASHHSGRWAGFRLPNVTVDDEQPGEITVLSTACRLPRPERANRWCVCDGNKPPGASAADSTEVGYAAAASRQPCRSGDGWGVLAMDGPRLAGRAPRTHPGVGRRVRSAADRRRKLAFGCRIVGGEVGFAGEASDRDPAASRLVRWQAAMQSADPPGINPAPLPVRKVWVNLTNPRGDR